MRRRDDRHDRTRWGREQPEAAGPSPQRAQPGSARWAAAAGHGRGHRPPVDPSPMRPVSRRCRVSGSRAGGWAVDYAIDVLEVVAEAGGNPI